MSPLDNSPVESRTWYRPGMSPADIRMWEAAERAAADAPEIRPGDDVALAVQQLFRGFPERLREYHAQQQNPAA